MGGVIISGFMGITQHLKGGKMRKFCFAILLLMLFVSSVFATDWSQYESGRNNIRLDGYDGQPGYIAFTDGNGTTYGYLYCSSNYVLYFASTSLVDLTTTKLNSQGVAVGNQS